MSNSSKIIKPTVLKALNETPKDALLLDIFQSALRELFFVDYPRFKKDDITIKKNIQDYYLKNVKNDSWIYYPWHNAIVHTLNEVLYLRLRTARNRNIITADEQEKYRNAKVSIAGLSVGSSILSSLVISGGPKRIKIADFDSIEISNLNRIKATLLDIGKSKAYVAAQQAWELDPFAEIDIWDKGLSQESLHDFLKETDIFIDEMDDIALKIQARLVCRENKIPVLMATDNGDSILLDIERFDLEPKRPIFHGALHDIQLPLTNSLDRQEWLSIADKIISKEFVSERMQSSLAEIGKTLAGIPQLGTTANTAGTGIAYITRMLANKQAISSGRYVVDFNKVFSQQEL